ncbi:hypothetical protein YC2023_102106 [Brassica napus]
MKKTTKAFLLLSWLHILLCLSCQVRVTEARFRHLGQGICAKPSPSCGDSQGSHQVNGQPDKPCKRIPRPPPPRDC